MILIISKTNGIDQRLISCLNTTLEETIEPYKNLHGESGVTEFEIGDTFITLCFKDAKHAYQCTRTR